VTIVPCPARCGLALSRHVIMGVGVLRTSFSFQAEAFALGGRTGGEGLRVPPQSPHTTVLNIANSDVWVWVTEAVRTASAKQPTSLASSFAS